MCANACPQAVTSPCMVSLCAGASLGHQLQLQQDSGSGTASIVHLTPVHGGGGMLQTGLMR